MLDPEPARELACGSNVIVAVPAPEPLVSIRPAPDTVAPVAPKNSVQSAKTPQFGFWLVLNVMVLALALAASIKTAAAIKAT